MGIINPTLRNHTHCQVAQADTQAKTCQRVWLPKRTDRQRIIKHENTTSCIVHLADSAKFEGITSNKRCSALTGLYFESPNDTIHVAVVVQHKPQLVGSDRSGHFLCSNWKKAKQTAGKLCKKPP